NLPADVSSFVGRAAEIDAVVAALAGARLVTLVGPGGVGKTRLALQAAARATPTYEDGVWLAELAAVVAPDLVAETVRAGLPGACRAGPSAPDLGPALADRRLLLVLDNCEHLRDGCAALVHGLLRRCPQVTVLATSRQPLGVTGERVHRVEPLSLPAAGANG